VLFLTLREMRAHARRLAGASLAVVLGVAFLTGTLVLGSTLRSNFDDLFADAVAGQDVVVRSETLMEMDSPRGLIDLSLVERVAAVDGVARAEPEVSGIGQLLGSDGEPIGGMGPPQLAGSWTEDPELNAFRLAEGRAPERSGEAVVDRSTLERGDLAIGDTTTLLTPEPVEVTIVGVATFGDRDGMAGVTFTGLTLEDAMAHLTGSADGVSSIAVRAEEGVSPDELAERLDAVLPGGVEAVTGEALADEQVDEIADTFLDMMLAMLTTFAGIALLVATFSIYNTFSILVAQRTRQVALLRAIGAGRGQVLRTVVLEALVVGLVAAAVGLVGGLGVAALLTALFDLAGFALPTGGMVVTASTVVTGLVVGVATTLVAAAAPAVRATRVAPLAALRDAAVERTTPSRARAVAGAAVLATGVGLTLAAATSEGGSVTVAGVGAVLTVVSAVVLGPVVARRAVSVLGAPVARLRGVPGGLARQNAVRNPRRTAATASALMVGVAVVTLFTVFASSLEASLEDTLDRTLASDLVVNDGAWGGGGFSPALADEVAALDEVEVATGLGTGEVRVDGDVKSVSVADPAELARVADLGVTAGSLADVGDGRIAVADDTASSHGWAVGDTVEVTFVDGRTEELAIAATYEADDLTGGYLLPRDVWEPHALQSTDRMVLVDVADGVDLDEAKAAVTEVADRFGGPNVEDREEFTATMTAGVDMMIGVVYALLALAVVIALMGIANTLSLAVHERSRELGLLRAVGTTRAQLRSAVRWESVVLAVFGAAGGIALGVFLGWALVETVSAATGGLGSFALPTGSLAVVLVAGALAGALASVRPARRAARLDVLTAIAAP